MRFSADVGYSFLTLVHTRFCLVQDIKPKKKTKDKKAGADGKKAKKETEEKWKW